MMALDSCLSCMSGVVFVVTAAACNIGTATGNLGIACFNSAAASVEVLTRDFRSSPLRTLLARHRTTARQYNASCYLDLTTPGTLQDGRVRKTDNNT